MKAARKRGGVKLVQIYYRIIEFPKQISDPLGVG